MWNVSCVAIYTVLFTGSESGIWQWVGSSLYLWIFNFIILLGCLIKLFVYGDPVLPAKSKESVAFWRHRRQADFDLSKVRYCPVCSSVNAFWCWQAKIPCRNKDCLQNSRNLFQWFFFLFFSSPKFNLRNKMCIFLTLLRQFFTFPSRD